MRFAILGPLEVRSGHDGYGGEVEVSGRRLRRLLLRLVVEAPRPVGLHDLVDAVWADEESPASAANALQALVSRLRRALGDDAPVRQAGSGYQLCIEPGDVDTGRFADLLAQARESASPAETVATLGEALALWRGTPLLDADGAEYAAALVARLDEQRLEATADRVAAQIDLGDAREVIPLLEELVSAHPLRDRFSVLLLRALTSAGRAAEALAAYERTRSYLADELGADPSPELRAAHLDVLRSDQPPVERAGPTNLRAARTRFIGRDAEVARLSGLLETGRLATVVGPGGAGKTRLAREVAASWVPRMPGGVWFVELAPVSDPTDIGATMLGVVGRREAPLLDRRQELRTHDTLDRLVEALTGAPALLVLDNCEHLVADVAAVVDQLLADCPQLRVLATSREPLGIDGEALTAIASLPMPPVDATADEATTYQSVQLFADRARAASGGFMVDEATVREVVEVVRRLDGLPLAIELAAARLRVLPLAEVARRLSDRFTLLTGGSRTALPRHQTLRAVVQWSWDLLTPAERLLVERLAVFAGDVSVPSAVAVAADDLLPAPGLPALLDALVEKSLLQVSPGPSLRYRMLETIREFGVERLAERGEVAAARTAHAHYFASLAKEAEPWLRTADQLPWLQRLDGERDNILAALRFLGDSGDYPAALAVARALGWYFVWLGDVNDAESWLSYALELPGDQDSDDHILVEAMSSLSVLGRMGQMSAERLDEAMREMATIGDRLAGLSAEGEPLVALLRPLLAFFTGRNELVLRYVREALESPDPWVRACTRMLRANLAENDGDVDQMRIDVDEAVAEFRAIGDRWGLAGSLSSLAQLKMLDGSLEEAVAAYQEAADLLSLLRSNVDGDLLHVRLADLKLRLGDVEGARREAERARDLRGLEGPLFSDMVLLAIARRADDADEVRRLRGVLRTHLAGMPLHHHMQDHARAVLLGVLAEAEMYDGHVDQAEADIRLGYETGAGTRDMPVLADVGVGLAILLERLDRPQESAEVLGASAALRGAEDPTNLRIAPLLAALRELLGTEFDATYGKGRGMDRATAIARLAPGPLLDEG